MDDRAGQVPAKSEKGKDPITTHEAGQKVWSTYIFCVARSTFLILMFCRDVFFAIRVLYGESKTSDLETDLAFGLHKRFANSTKLAKYTSGSCLRRTLTITRSMLERAQLY